MQAAKLIGSSPLITNYAYSCSFFNLNSIYAHSLRWKRKPIWLPTAKSKVFRVPQRKHIEADEFAEIQRLYNNYRTYMRSIKHHFYLIGKQNEIELDQSVIDKAEEEDYNRCMKINDEWNKKIAAEREIRLQQEKEERTARILQNIEEKKKRDQKILLEVEEKVKKVKKLAPTFITRENIDQAIEEALANVVNHNKALDLNGNWYTDDSGLSITLKEPQKIKVNQ